MSEKKPRKRKLSDVIDRLETGAAPPDPAVSAILAPATSVAVAAMASAPVAAPAPAAVAPAAAAPAPKAAVKRKTPWTALAALVAIIVMLMVAGPAVLVVFTNPVLAVIFLLAMWKLWDWS